MPYDPTLPQAGTEIDAVQMRGQFNGLKDLIDAVQTITTAVVDGTSTLNPGEPAQASVNWDGANVRFTFGIPRGHDGVSSPPITSFIVDGVSTLNPGEPATVQTSFNGASVGFLFGIPRGNDGTNGSNGNDGGPGAQGPPFANAVVDSVTTLNPGDNATVQTSFDGSNVRFQFGIPRGQNGNDGGPGQPGTQGEPGPAGEVTNAQLNAAINGSSSNSNAITTLGMLVSDPPTQGQMQQIADKLDELILALRR